MIFDLNFDRLYEKIKNKISRYPAFNLYNTFYRFFKERYRKFRQDEKFRAKTGIEDHVKDYMTWLVAEELLKQKPLQERIEAFRRLKDERKRMDAPEYCLAEILTAPGETYDAEARDEQDSRIAEFERKFLD